MELLYLKISKTIHLANLLELTLALQSRLQFFHHHQEYKLFRVLHQNEFVLRVTCLAMNYLHGLMCCKVLKQADLAHFTGSDAPFKRQLSNND